MAGHSTDQSKSQARFGTSVEFGKRLAEERGRFGATQKDFGARAGVTLDSQSRYETGKTVPNAEYLAALAAVGVDVNYLLTGLRERSHILDGESTSLLRDFELLAPHLRTAAIGVIRALALGDPDKGGGTIQMREDQQHYRNHGI
ncbi:MAG: helix-turn-helix transcriptional regulator [Alphaproteobacteria bacterium]|nr:MAG: helix-turn-helix transcriptional regulator [Alphaproteobacteria bacterium]